jgi:UDP-GlcNAc3NAcA epimerase
MEGVIMKDKKKILSVIGTRPQYIKIKPFFDYCDKNHIQHVIVDTLQHYSYNVSDVFIKEFGLHIDHSVNIENLDELSFISNLILKLKDIYLKESPDIILVYGDTNSTFAAALAAYKLNIPLAHIEAGERGFHMIPEEVNRIFVDTVSNLKFCSSKKSASNLSDGIFSGDLEYEFLNNINPDVSYGDFGVMTIHRQGNMSIDRLQKIFSFLARLKCDIKFFMHHRTRIFMASNKILMPQNIKILEPCGYKEMVRNMAESRFIITDSGSVQKTSPFFGKKALIMREEGLEWKKTEDFNYARKCKFTDEDIEWISDFKIDRDKRFYMNQSGVCKLIIEFTNKYLEDNCE